MDEGMVMLEPCIALDCYVYIFLSIRIVGFGFLQLVVLRLIKK